MWSYLCHIFIVFTINWLCQFTKPSLPYSKINCQTNNIITIRLCGSADYAVRTWQVLIRFFAPSTLSRQDCCTSHCAAVMNFVLPLNGVIFYDLQKRQLSYKSISRDISLIPLFTEQHLIILPVLLPAQNPAMYILLAALNSYSNQITT